MNKQEFLNQLRDAFTKYEIPEDKSEKYFKKFEKLIDEEKTKVEKYSQMKAVTTERINVLKAK